MKASKQFLSNGLSQVVMAVFYLWGSQSYAYTLITNEADFLSQYNNPTEIIDFLTLKDGTAISDINYSSPYWTGVISAGQLEIRENAWSDNYLIRARKPYNFYHTATYWNGNSVTPSPTSNYLSIYSLVDAKPISLYTTNGFLGIIPDDVNEKHLVIYEVQPGTRVLEMQAGFTPVPIPASAWLLTAGLAFVSTFFRKPTTHGKSQLGSIN